jgi:hypothetical protein
MYSSGYHAFAWLSCTRLTIMHASGYHALVWLSCTHLAITYSLGYRALAWISCTLLAIVSCRVPLPCLLWSPLATLLYPELPYLPQDTKPTSLVPCIFACYHAVLWLPCTTPGHCTFPWLQCPPLSTILSSGYHAPRGSAGFYALLYSCHDLYMECPLPLPPPSPSCSFLLMTPNPLAACISQATLRPLAAMLPLAIMPSFGYHSLPWLSFTSVS